jgi:hypothetical protein
MRLAEMQVCPEFRYLHSSAPASAASRSASSKTMNGALPPSSSETFLTCPALGHQQLADLGRAGEAELAHEWVLGHLQPDPRRILGVAGDDAQHTRGQPGLLAEAHHGQRRERRLLCRLEHHRAAGAERGGRLAGRHRGREVPRGDPGGHPDRFLRDDDSPVRRVGRDRVAVDPFGLLAEPLHEARRIRDLDSRLRQRLALLGGEENRQLLLAFEHQIRPAAHDPSAVTGQQRSPSRQRAIGGFDRPPRLPRPHPGHGGDHPAACRIHDVEGRSVVGVDPAAVDVGLAQQQV